jgi:uncharacterized membrane protein
MITSSRAASFARLVRRAVLAWFVFALVVGAGPAQAKDPVVRAVLFYSPTCPHCHQVITEDLPPLIERYGDRLEIVGIDTTDPQGDALYLAAVDLFSIPADRRGVPALVIGDIVLVGAREIPELFPKLIEEHLAAGGVDWPPIPGLLEALPSPEPDASGSPEPDASVRPTPAGAAASPAAGASAAAAAEATPGAEAAAGLVLPDAGDAGPLDNLGRDPVGNGLAVAALLAMLVSLCWAVLTVLRAGRGLIRRAPSRAIPLLCLAGLGVAAYLAYAETADVSAVCGPVGDCNTVQQSPYAWLFGIVPIGILGIAGYLVILASWAAGRLGEPRLAEPARVALVVATMGGTAFSIYLTFLEPFVIGATCAWCLTSAAIVTLLMLIAVRTMAVLPGREQEPPTGDTSAAEGGAAASA